MTTVARKYLVELHNGDDKLVCILDNAYLIAYSEGINEAPTLSFNLPADDSKATNIIKANEIWLRDYDAGTLVNRFRLTRKSDTRGVGLAITVNADGLINQLAEELIITYSADSLTITQIVTALIALQVLSPAITVGTIDPTVSRSISVENDTLLKALFRLRDTVGGHIYVDKNRALQWRTTIGENKGQQIRYRKNLKGITREIDYITLANRLYAYGAGEGDARIKLSDADGQEEDYIEDTDSQTEWGGIYVKVIVDKSITHPNTLLAWATLRLAELKDPRITYRVNTVDLSESIEIDFSFEALQIGSTIKVIDEDLGISISAQVVKITHPDLLHPEQMQLEITNPCWDITDVLTGVYDTQQLIQHIATTIGAGQVIVQGAFTVKDWVTEGETTIVGSNIETGTITAVQLSAGEIITGSAQIKDGIITNAKIDTLAATKITGQVVDAQIANIEYAKIDNVAVDTADIVNLAVETAKIGALAVTEAKIGNLAVTVGKIGNLAVTNAKINDLNAGKINAGDIATARLSLHAADGVNAGGVVITASKISITGKSLTDLADRNLNNIADGATYGRVLLTDISAGHILLSSVEQTSSYRTVTDANKTTWNGKIITFRQDSVPTAVAGGDLWVDTNDKNKLYRATNAGDDQITLGEWEIVRDTDIAQAIADAAAAQSTADGKIVTFFQAGIPTSTDIGDLWVDTDDKNKIYRAACVGADEITAGEWEIARDTDIAQAISDAAGAQATADGKVVTFYQDAEPTAEGVGDLWVDTNDNNKLYRWSGAAWVQVIWMLDVIQDGTYSRVLTTDISAGHIKLSEVVQTSSYRTVNDTEKGTWNDKMEGDADLDDIANGVTYSRVLTTDISAGHIKLSEVVEDATYKKYLGTERTKLTGIDPGADVTGDNTCDDPWSGHDLDDLGEGTTYQRVRATDISAGHILLSSVTEVSGEWYNESGVEIDAAHGINIYGVANALTTRATKTGTIQCYVGADGKIYAGAGSVALSSDGITIKGETLRFLYDSTLVGYIRATTAAQMSIVPAAGVTLVIQGTPIICADHLKPIGTTKDLGDASLYWRELFVGDISLVGDIIPTAQDTSILGSVDRMFSVVWTEELLVNGLAVAESFLASAGGDVDFRFADWLDLPRRTSYPAGFEGRFFYDTVGEELMLYARGSWQVVWP